MQVRVLACLGWIVLAGSTTVLAQQPAARAPMPTPPATTEPALGEVKATPEMWFYLQERQRYDSPKYAVRKNAELDASRRSERMAALKWLGQSPERPNCYSTVFGGHFPGTFPYGNADRWNSYFSVGTTPWQPNR